MPNHTFVKINVCLILLLNAWALAQDQFPPNWRGQDGTTLQQFSFDDDTNPVTVSNEAGIASAAITVGTFGAGWFDNYLDLGQQTGYWDIGGADGSIVLDIDNFQAGDGVLVWIQITYWEDISVKPTISIIPGVTPYQQENWQDVVIDEDVLGAWKVWQSTWTMDTVPEEVQVTLQGAVYGTIIDQIVIDIKITPDVCIVDLDDLAAMCQQWLQTGTELTYDLNNSERVDIVDFSILAYYWQQICPW